MNTVYIKEQIDNLVYEGIVAGISAAIIEEDSSTFMIKGKMGKIAPYDTKELELSSLYDMASCTKVVATTTRILQLIEQGKIELDDRVCKYLADFRHQDVTIRQLLLHDSGLPADLEDKKTLTKDNIYERIMQTDLVHRPEEVTVYSDIGFILLGFIIAKVDGKDLAATYKKNIFDVLKMNDSTFDPDKSRCVPEELTPARGLIVGECHDSKGYILKGRCGSAGLFSTIGDITAFARSLLYARDGILKRETIELLLATNVNGRSLGWDKKYGDGILYHTGFTGTSIMLDYRKMEGLILLTNRVHPSRNNDAYLNWRNELNDHIVKDI